MSTIQRRTCFLLGVTNENEEEDFDVAIHTNRTCTYLILDFCSLLEKREKRQSTSKGDHFRTQSDIPIQANGYVYLIGILVLYDSFIIFPT